MGLFKRSDRGAPATTDEQSGTQDAEAATAVPEEPTRQIADPGLPSDHPRQMFHQNLCVADSMTWYASTDQPHDVLDYVLSLLELSPDLLMYAEEGFAMNDQQTLLLIGLQGPRTSSVTVFGMDGGASLLNAALEREWAVTMDQMSRGEFRGHPADHVRILHGEVHDDFAFKSAEVTTFLHESDVVSLKR